MLVIILILMLIIFVKPFRIALFALMGLAIHFAVLIAAFTLVMYFVA